MHQKHFCWRERLWLGMFSIDISESCSAEGLKKSRGEGPGDKGESNGNIFALEMKEETELTQSFEKFHILREKTAPRWATHI